MCRVMLFRAKHEDDRKKRKEKKRKEKREKKKTMCFGNPKKLS